MMWLRSLLSSALLITTCSATIAQSGGKLKPAITILDRENPRSGKTTFTGCATGTEVPTLSLPLFNQEMLVRLNAYRVQEGLLPLKRNPELTVAASYHAQDMGDDQYFEHNTYDCADNDIFDSNPPPCAASCGTFDRIDAFFSGNASAENIAAGYNTPDAVMDAWKNSSGHNQNMLSTSSREVGMGYYNDGPTSMAYWVQNFGSQAGVYPVIINLDSLETESQNVFVHIHRPGNDYNELRLSNDSLNWSAWQAYPNNGSVNWTLEPGQGLKTVYVELRNGNGQVYANSDEIDYIGLVTHAEEPLNDAASQPRIYPNPVTSNTFYINAGGAELPEVAKIFSISGERLATLPVRATGAVHLPAQIANGLYIVQAGQHQQRLVVQR